MAITKKGFTTKAVLEKIYPMVANAMGKNLNAWRRCMSNFMQKRSAMLFDTMPCDRIYFSQKDVDELFDEIGRASCRERV